MGVDVRINKNELSAHVEKLVRLRAHATGGPVTIVCAARAERHYNAVVLAEALPR